MLEGNYIQTPKVSIEVAIEQLETELRLYGFDNDRIATVTGFNRLDRYYNLLKIVKNKRYTKCSNILTFEPKTEIYEMTR